MILGAEIISTRARQKRDKFPVVDSEEENGRTQCKKWDVLSVSTSRSRRLGVGPVRLESRLGLGPKGLGVSSRVSDLFETFRSGAPCVKPVCLSP